MTAIYKYPLAQPIDMPAGARILTVQMQHGSPFVWAVVDPSAPRVNRRIRVYGSGHELPPNVQLSRGAGLPATSAAAAG